jgi:superfamily II DNA or RNA helicase
MGTDTFEELKSLLRYRPSGYAFAWEFKNHRWDGWLPLYRVKADGSMTFPSGLLPRVLEALKDVSVEVLESHQETLQATMEPSPLPDGTALYPDQIKAVRKALAARRGLLALAPNFGKTEVIAGLLQALGKKKALVLVPGKTLLEQTANHLTKRLLEPICMFTSGRRPPAGERIVVANIESARARWNSLKEFVAGTEVLIADEVHKVTVNGWYPILNACQASVRIGMSGTVREANSLLVLEGPFGPVLDEVKDSALVKSGRSAEAKVYMVRIETKTPFGLDYKMLYDLAVTFNTKRNHLLAEVVTRLVRKEGHPALVLYYRLPHGRALDDEFQKLGVNCRRLSGSNVSPELLQNTRDELGRGKLDVVVASTVWNTGVNIPYFSIVANAAGWKSEQATAQKLGRGLRKKPWDDNRVTIIDTWDLGSTLLSRHSQGRKKLYEKRGFMPEVVDSEAIF